MSSSRTYPDHPFLGVSTVIQHKDHVVLIERGKEPLVGIWSLPGGIVETGEHLEQAIIREIQEEIGLDIKPDRMSELVEILRWDEDERCERHYAIGVFYSDLTSKIVTRPKLSAGDDAKDAHWVAIDKLNQYTLTDGTFDVIHRVLSGSQIPLTAG